MREMSVLRAAVKKEGFPEGFSAPMSSNTLVCKNEEEKCFYFTGFCTNLPQRSRRAASMPQRAARLEG